MSHIDFTATEDGVLKHLENEHIRLGAQALIFNNGGTGVALCSGTFHMVTSLGLTAEEKPIVQLVFVDNEDPQAQTSLRVSGASFEIIFGVMQNIHDAIQRLPKPTEN